MLTRWLTLTTLLAWSAKPQKTAFTVAPTCRVEGHPETELNFKCGDGKNAGFVQYWHTPFGELQTPGFHKKQDPVFMLHDQSLVVPNTSVVHSGLYYCLLQHTEGMTLWPYELHVSPTAKKNQEHRKYKHSGSCDTFRFRRDVWSEAEEPAGVTDGQFAGAVAASVLLTFVLGFSTGALSRTKVLRCLGGVTTWLRSLQKQKYQTDVSNQSSEATMTTLTPRYNNQSIEMEPVDKIFSKALSPPAKPQRSLRIKQEEEQGTTTYLEGCDYMQEEQRIMEEVGGKDPEKINKVCERETEEEDVEFYLTEDRGGQRETDEDICSEQGEEKERRKSTEETKEERQEVEEKCEQENMRNNEQKGERASEEEGVNSNKDKGRDNKMEKEKEWKGKKQGESQSREENKEMDICSKIGTKEHAMVRNGIKEGETVLSPPHLGRCSRVIRLYQYDDEGQRYCHLPEPSPDEPGPAPRVKHRSISLTRLNAIMAITSATPLDARETDRKETPHML